MSSYRNDFEMKARIPALMAVAFAATLLTACASDGERGTLERAGEATDDALESAGERVSDTADRIESSGAWQRIEGNWKQFTGAVKARWGELTDDEVAEVDGNKDQLVGKVQDAYGTTRQEAEEQVDEWAAEQ